jgi:hypothetical protein
MTNKILAGLFALAALATPSSAIAEGFAELRASNQNTSLDLKTSGDLGANFGFFGRHTSTVDREENISPFTLVDVSYNLPKGTGVFVEGQGADHFTPRAGVNYFGKKGDFDFYGALSTSLDRDAELYTATNFKPEVNEELSLPLRVETVTNVGELGHNYSSVKARAGIGYNDWEFQAATDCEIFGNAEDHKCVYGAAISKRFK